jgi:hypothetical protein
VVRPATAKAKKPKAKKPMAMKPTRKTPRSARRAPVIEPLAVYRLPQLQQLLGLKDTTLGREIREGRLKASKVSYDVVVVGQRVLEWLELREVNRPVQPARRKTPRATPADQALAHADPTGDGSG